MSRSFCIHARRPLTLALLLAALAATPVSAAPFVTEIAATPGYPVATALAIDAYDVPHIAFLDFNGVLHYVTRLGGAWVSEPADTFSADGYYSSVSIAVDADRQPHIAYYANGSDILLYAAKLDGAWVRETIDEDGDVGTYNSIAIDDQGRAHVSYYSETDDELRYALRDGGWMVETADGSHEVGYWTSIAVDATGRAHISYWDEDLKNLKYARQTEPYTWVLQAVDTAGQVGEYSSLALDSEGNPTISYYDRTNTNLKVARRSVGVWSFENVDTVGNVGIQTSLELDPNGGIHVAYNKGFDLRYAYKTGGTWTTEDADVTARNSMFGMPSLALDAQGNPVIGYFDDYQDLSKVASASIRVDEPGAGDEWMIGSIKNIAWTGVGPVEIALSTDGGASFGVLVAQANTTPYAIRVPRTITNHARIRLTRTEPVRIAFSDSSFTIDSTVALSVFYGGGSSSGMELTWRTDPGPEDLAGYRLERSSLGGGWQKVITTRATTYRDPAGVATDRYRLIAINNFGGELTLGEWSATPGLGAASLAAWPAPFRGGTMNVSFSTFGGLGGGTGEAEVGLYDLHGRLVRQLVHGAFPAGSHVTTWDGRDARGEPIDAGIYFLRASSAGQSRLLKVAVIR